MKSMLNRTDDPMRMIPPSTRYSTEYKAAFEAACGEQAQPVYPFARRAKEEVLIRELGFFPWALADWQMQILENAGAYIPIGEHARNRLLEAEVLATDLPGTDCLNRCVRRLIPELEHDVSVRQYRFSTPRALNREGRIVLAEPMPCKKCIEKKCSCWVGAALVRIMQEYDTNADLDSIFWVYDQERRLANEQERLAGQIQTQNIMPEAHCDGVQASTSGTETKAISGLAVGWSTGDEDSGNETWNGSTTVQNLATTENEPSPSNVDYHHENADASKSKTKVYATLNMENPPTAQSNTPTPSRPTRKSYATLSKSSGNALNNLDQSPRTSAHQAETPSKATEQ
ncbi:hypothetical protein GJ744_002805 [Endocarpon pusillum]|uniref:Uncharacterized protein n=1 Tax=Endocarpon pusillum TaxID=364733 RepID=A0A8H7ASD6_9EURO|nr:hypothetical protein GJ744_002805 [Endocarpon pusillum]